MIENLNAEFFRQKLAGLIDESGGEDAWEDEYRELASDFVLLLAINFNRKQLDPVTLWSRIDSAIQKGLAECDGADTDKLIHICLDHIQANVNVVASDEQTLTVCGKIASLTKERRTFFCGYLTDHRYVAIVLGREKWELRKADKKELAKSEGGEV